MLVYDCWLQMLIDCDMLVHSKEKLPPQVNIAALNLSVVFESWETRCTLEENNGYQGKRGRGVWTKVLFFSIYIAVDDNTNYKSNKKM